MSDGADAWSGWCGRPEAIEVEATVKIPVGLAWRMYCRTIAPGELRRAARIRRDHELGSRLLRTVAIVA